MCDGEYWSTDSAVGGSGGQNAAGDHEGEVVVRGAAQDLPCYSLLPVSRWTRWRSSQGIESANAVVGSMDGCGILGCCGSGSQMDPDVLLETTDRWMQ